MNLVQWVKDNKVAAAGIAGLAFLFMAKKGGGDGGGGDTADVESLDSGGGMATIAVPAAYDSNNEGVYDVSGDAYKEGIDRGIDLATDLYEQEPPADEDVPSDEGNDPDETDTPPTDTKQGITLHGHFFAGATGYTITGVAQGWTNYLITFPGRAERWAYKDGQWKQTWEDVTASDPPAGKGHGKGKGNDGKNKGGGNKNDGKNKGGGGNKNDGKNKGGGGNKNDGKAKQDNADKHDRKPDGTKKHVGVGASAGTSAKTSGGGGGGGAHPQKVVVQMPKSAASAGRKR